MQLFSRPRPFTPDQTDGQGACSGDFGGPAIETVSGVPTVSGVTSRAGLDGTLSSQDQRTDAESAFIASYAPEPEGSATARVAPAAAARRRG